MGQIQPFFPFAFHLAHLLARRDGVFNDLNMQNGKYSRIGLWHKLVPCN